jgi:uncharacterized protein YbjT (DUF2867 family)
MPTRLQPVATFDCTCGKWARTLERVSLLSHAAALICLPSDQSRLSRLHSGEEEIMKVVVIGGSGLIGSKLVDKLREHGHVAVAASPDTGVNTLTGDGLAQALVAADVVVDVSNSPSFEDSAVLEFFETSTGNLLAAELQSGVGHHVALSVVNADMLPDSGYLRAKVAQENLIAGAGLPYSIVRATQFFEFFARIAQDATDGDTVRLPDALIQPMAADDVAAAVGKAAVGAPVNGIIEITGPQPFRFVDFVSAGLRALGDPRHVVAARDAKYYGAALQERSLLAGPDAQTGPTTLEGWLARSRTAA